MVGTDLKVNIERKKRSCMVYFAHKVLNPGIPHADCLLNP